MRLDPVVIVLIFLISFFVESSMTMGACIGSKKKDVPENIDLFMARIRPLDLIVFKGAEGVSKLISKLEQHETGSGAITHVEVAMSRLWCSKIKYDAPDTALFSWGSTLSGPLNDGTYNAETLSTSFGVQFRVLKDLITSYAATPGANVGFCRLKNNPIVKRSDERIVAYCARAEILKAKIADAYDTYNGCKYEANLLALLGALFPEVRPLRDAVSGAMAEVLNNEPWLFCSEFVAVFYEHMGIITDATDGKLDGKVMKPEDTLPVDLVTEAICDQPIWLKSAAPMVKK